MEQRADFLSEQELAIVAQHILGHKWKQLAYCLQVPQTTVQQLDGRFKRSGEYCFQVLKVWKDHANTLQSSSRDMLMKALTECGYDALSGFIQRG